MNFNAEDLISRSKQYDEDKFKIDLDNLLNTYNQLKPINPDDVRQEIDSWDLSVPKDTNTDLEEISGAYTRFVEYNIRINKLLDDVNIHNQLLIFIIKTGKELAYQYIEGKTKADKESVATSILLPISSLQNTVNSLYDFISNTNKSIEFASSQLARILREREALGKINNENYRQGSNAINKNNNRDVVVNTRNKIKE